MPPMKIMVIFIFTGPYWILTVTQIKNPFLLMITLCALGSVSLLLSDLLSPLDEKE